MESETKTAPAVRIRIAHSSTVKEGWRCSETTAEWTGVGSPTAGDLNDLENLMKDAYAIGANEAERRNRDGAPAT